MQVGLGHGQPAFQRGDLQRARLPVAPGRVLLLAGAQRLQRLQQLLPGGDAAAGGVAGGRLAQQRAGAPGDGVVGPVDAQRVAHVAARLVAFGVALGAVVLRGGLGQQLERRPLRQRGPGPARQVRGQRRVPAPLQRLDVAGGQPHQGQRRQLGRRARAGGGLAGQVARRVVQHLVQRLGDRGPEQRQRLAHRARAVGVGGGTGLGPDVGAAELACLEQRRGHRGAAFVGVALGQPGGACGVAHLASRLLLDQQAVADHVAVVVHPEAGTVRGEGSPVLAAAELEQPVVAQPVLDVGAGPARVEGLHLGHRRLGQAQVQVPVVDPHRQRMAARQHRGAQRRQPGAVALAPGLACVEQRLGPAWRGRRPPRRRIAHTAGSAIMGMSRK
ncbi:hypothetical protein ABXN37_20970 [Piscinibacter sakaiensis]